MANRVVEWLASLKDGFTGKIEAITKGIERNASASEKASERVRAANTRTAKSFSILEGGIGRVARLLGGAYIGRQAVRSITDFADQADRLQKLGAKLGASTEALSALGFVAEQNGVKVESLNTALQRLTRRTAEARNGTGEAVGALQELGVSADQLADLDADEKLKLLADAFQDVESQADRVRLAFKLFDTEGVDLVRILQLGSEEIQTFIDQAGELGRVIDQETADSASRFNENLNVMRSRLIGVRNDIGGQTLEGFNLFFKAVGIGLTPLEKVNREIRDTQALIEDLKSGDFSVSDLFLQKSDSTRQFDLEEAQAKLAALYDRQVDITSKGNKKTEDSERGLTKATIEATEQRLDAFKAELREREALVREYESQIKQLERQQQSTADEFAALVREAQAARGATNRPADFLETSLAVKTAQALLSRGELDKALEQARAAADMVRGLKEAGDASSLTLGFLAKELQRVAIAAEQSKIDSAKRAQELAKTYIAETRSAMNEELAKAQKPLLPAIDVQQAAKDGAAALKTRIEAELAAAPPVANVRVNIRPTVQDSAEMAAAAWEAEIQRRGIK